MILKELVGRREQIAMLKHMAASNQAEFVAVYGRRRVGKTYLVKEFFQHKFTFYATGLATGDTKMQLNNFASYLKAAFRISSIELRNWMEAFEVLEKQLKKIKKGKKIIFIDELPWMDTKRSDLVPALEKFWNGWASTQRDIKLIVCGSSASWMMHKLIHSKGGFYNRLTMRLKLEPFTLREVEQLLISKKIDIDRYQVAQLYMALGGIPYYYSLIKRGKSAVQIIQELCFDGPLSTEFNYIFDSLFAQGSKHEQLLRIIYKLKNTATRDQIVKKAKLYSSGEISKKLRELEESGFIGTTVAYGIRSQKKLYHVTDFYSLFFLQFIEPSKALRVKWSTLAQQNGTQVWQGLAFEQVCLGHILSIKTALGIQGIHANAYTWQSKSAQIDLIIDRSDRTINLCEIKFSRDEYIITKSYDLKLRAKISAFKSAFPQRKTIFFTMITTYGLHQNAYSNSAIHNELCLDDLFL